MVKSPDARRRLELFRAAYNRRLMLMRSTEELEQSRVERLTPQEVSSPVRVQAGP
jgi:hypothetical protein